MLISIVIPTYNGEKTLGRVFKMIYSQKTSNRLEIICVDSSSCDRTVEICRRYNAAVISISKKQFNHGLTRDFGVKNSHGEYIILLTQDAVPANEYWLDSMISSISKDENVAGVYSRQIPNHCCDPLSRFHIKFYIGYNSERKIQVIDDLISFSKLTPWNKYQLIHFANVSSCIRRRVWEKIPFGKCDFGEDMAWSKRVLEAGYKVVFEPSSIVVHSHNYTCFKYFKRLYVDHQNLNKLIELRLVPKLYNAIYNGVLNIPYFWSVLNKEKTLPWRSKLYWKLYAIPYGMIGPLAQYAGANSNRWANRKNIFFHIVNNILTKGI